MRGNFLRFSAFLVLCVSEISVRLSDALWSRSYLRIVWAVKLRVRLRLRGRMEKGSAAEEATADPTEGSRREAKGQSEANRVHRSLRACARETSGDSHSSSRPLAHSRRFSGESQRIS